MSDWFEAEPPLPVVLTGELRRLKRRAQARWPLVLAIGLALTAAVVWKVARKPAVYRARVVLVITEGDNVSGRDATPLNELRDYIFNVLLTNGEVLSLIEKQGLYRTQRRTLGDEFVVTSFRDSIGIAVWRNYFQYSYTFDDRRTARVAVQFTDIDREFAYEMSRQLANIVIRREDERRVEAAEQLQTTARDVREASRAALVLAQTDERDGIAELRAAEAGGDSTEIAILRMKVTELTASRTRAEQNFDAVEGTTSTEAFQAALTAAGLALDIQVVDERKPPLAERPTIVLVLVALVALCFFLPLAGVVIGAFDTRIHDLEDVTRLDLAPLGHLPGFPGDRVGALRDRGVPHSRMPSWVPWR